MAFDYNYPKPNVSVDCVVFGLDIDHILKILLIKRRSEPFLGNWALPGHFIQPNESLKSAVMRTLHETIAVKNIFLEQLYAFGAPERDPCEWSISVSYFGLLNLHDHSIQADADANDIAWWPIDQLPILAIDHQKIIDAALVRLQQKLRYAPISFELLPKKFTLPQLQKLYERILNTEFDKRNFRRKIHSMDLLIKHEELQTGVAHRAARLYSFDNLKYEQLKTKGYRFEI